MGITFDTFDTHFDALLSSSTKHKAVKTVRFVVLRHLMAAAIILILYLVAFPWSISV